MVSTAVLIVALVAQSVYAQMPDRDPFQMSEALIVLAIEQGTVREFPPIPLDQDGATTHGVVFDQFRMIARTARAAAAARARLDPRSVAADIVRPRTVVLAYPLSCNGRAVGPLSIDIIDMKGASAGREGDYIRDAGIGTLLPGVQAPVSSLAAAFAIQTLRANDTVRITYTDGSCTGGTPELALPIRYTAPRPLETPTPTLPAGLSASDTPVRLQALVDLDGMLHRAVYVSGPAHLTRAALDAVQRWRSEPPRINGAPVVRGVLLQVLFRQ